MLLIFCDQVFKCAMNNNARSSKQRALGKKTKRIEPRKDYSENEQREGIDFVASLLSKELVLKTFSYLSSKDLRQCALVSSRWCAAANDEMLWKPLFYERFHTPRIAQQKHQLESVTLNHIYRPQNKRRAVVTYRDSWKLTYKLHRNWLLGHCQISDICFQDEGSDKSAHVRHLQILNNLLFINRETSSKVEIWRYGAHNTGFAAKLVHRLYADVIKEDVHITHLKLCSEQEGKTHLIAGYSNGGFTIWELDKITPEGFTKDNITEICTYTESIHRQRNNCVSSVSLNYPILAVHTAENVSIFEIEKATVKLIHQLQSTQEYGWNFVSFNILRYTSGRPLEHWKIELCFVFDVAYPYLPTVGIQEFFIFKSGTRWQWKSIVNFPHTTGNTRSSTSVEPTSFNPLTSFDWVTSLAYSPPHLIVAHANNTIERYSVMPEPTAYSVKLHINQTEVLHEHAYKIEAVAIDAQKQKLISADRSCIKIWDLQNEPLRSRCRGGARHSPVTIPIIENQTSLKELPFCKIEELVLNEDKIAAVIYSPVKGTSSIRIWSFQI